SASRAWRWRRCSSTQRSRGAESHRTAAMSRMRSARMLWRNDGLASRQMSVRLARVAGAVAVVAWAVVQLEGRRPRPRIPEVSPATPAPDGPPPAPETSGVEIERKFRAEHAPADLQRYPRVEIEQGYLAIDGEVELRIRRLDESTTVLTLKAGSGESRLEEEFEIDGSRFGALWPLTAQRRLRKVRYRIPAGDGLAYELDVYGGWLSGLMTAEIEFPSLEARAAFRPPSWLGREVTGDPTYKNQAL